MAGVKLLSESKTFKDAIAQIKAEVQGDNSGAVGPKIEAYFQTLGNEANGDPVPGQGLYLSGSGVVKVA